MIGIFIYSQYRHHISTDTKLQAEEQIAVTSERMKHRSAPPSLTRDAGSTKPDAIPQDLVATQNKVTKNPAETAKALPPETVKKIQKEAQEPAKKIENQDPGVPRQIFAIIDTSFGSITILLKPKIAPKTVKNFIELAEGREDSEYLAPYHLNGRPFYNGLTIFRVISGYFIQMGDPLNNGRGGPGYTVPDEFNTKAKEIEAGMVIMAHAGIGTTGSQFVIALRRIGELLDDNNTQFGAVLTGLPIAERISQVKTNIFDNPVTPIVLKEVKIQRIYKSKVRQK